MKKPLIGIVPLFDRGKDSYWMLPGYMKGIALFGGIPLMLPLSVDPRILEDLVCRLDGFLLTGGQDVCPTLYGEEPMEACGETCQERDQMESLLLNYALKTDKPILGICRGLQFLNVYLGGTLYQDLPTERASKTEHHMSPPYNRAIHKVSLVNGTPLYNLLGTNTLAVNSYHHQAIKEVAPSLNVMAYSEDELIESVYLPNKRFVWGVQWHPEFSYQCDPNSRLIFEAFVSMAAE